MIASVTSALLVAAITALAVIIVAAILVFCGELLAHWRGEDF